MENMAMVTAAAFGTYSGQEMCCKTPVSNKTKVVHPTLERDDVPCW
jgi:hypothetical protein